MEEHYYKVNRVFLNALGLWPYQQSYRAQIRKVLFFSVFLTFIIVQLLAFFTMQFTIELLVKILTFVLPLLFVATKYLVFIIQADNVKMLLERMRNDLRLLRDEMEINIIKKYAYSMRFITMISMTVCSIAVTGYVILRYIRPLMLNVILPLNVSRTLEFIVITEYFINREKYVWVILFHEVITFYIGITTVCITAGTIMMYILHGCAMLKIASCRIENAIDKNVLAISNSTTIHVLQRRVVLAIHIHRRAIAFHELATSTFRISFACLIGIGVSSLSFNLVHLLQLLRGTRDITEIYTSLGLIIFHVGYMFVLNYGGEEVQSHGLQVFDAIYNGHWYVAPLHTQKLLLFVMQRAAVKMTLVCGGIFIVSMEGFVTLVSSAVSYFTVMYSARQ